MRAIASAVAALALLVPSPWQHAAPQANPIGLAGLEGTSGLTDSAGNPFSWKPYAGKRVIVTVWASWCLPCTTGLSTLKASEAANKDLVFLYVNYGEPPELVSTFLQEQGIPTLNILLDRSRLGMGPLTAGFLPSTLFLEANGKVAWTVLGEMSAESLAVKIRALRARGSEAGSDAR